MYPSLRERRPFERRMASQLLRFGGWLTVSGLVGPLLLYLGRVVIALKLSAEAVAYFVVPYEVVTQMLLIPSMVAGVLFPAFSRLASGGVGAAMATYQRTLAVVAAVMLPACGAVVLCAKPGLDAWVGAEFASHGFRVAQILAAGVFINSFGLVSQILVQANGRPDWSAKLHVLELVLYVPYLVALTEGMGIEGAAMAWTLRVSLSTLALLYLARLSMPKASMTLDHRDCGT
jgi:O-antigen/teichoic acid export membrane protein